jgi:hypothetical protein
MEMRPIERRFVEAVWDGCLQKEAAARCGLTLVQANHVLRALKDRCDAPSTIALLRRLVREGVLQA